MSATLASDLKLLLQLARKTRQCVTIIRKNGQMPVKLSPRKGRAK